MKDVAAAVAIVLVFINYIPYVRNIIRGKTHPHIYSWFLWTLITLIVFALQVSDHAGPGAFVTLAAGMFSLTVLILGFRLGKKNITRSDTAILIITFIAIGLWIFAKQPALSAILVTFADLLAFIPTIRKSWHQPNTETLFLYAMNTLRFVLVLYALQNYTIPTALNPASWLVANSLFSLMLIIRRRTLAGQVTLRV